MARKRPTLNDLLRNVHFNQLYERYKGLFINRFEWTLPDGALFESRHIEQPLFNKGLLGAFIDPNMGLMILPVNPEGGMNVYGEFMKYRAIGVNYSRSLDRDDVVLIRNNPTATNSSDLVMYYVNEMVSCMKTASINIKQQKTPYIIKGEEKDMLTLKNIMAKVDDHEVAIYTDKSLNATFDVVMSPAPYIADKIFDYKNDLENELLTLLGINNANTDKKERLITDEVNANNHYIMLNVDMMINEREKACEMIREKFGIDISVKLREGDYGTVYSDSETISGEQHQDI